MIITAYNNRLHRKNYRRFLRNFPSGEANEFLGAAFLLSADNVLWSHSNKVIFGKKIDFDRIDKTELTAEAYTLLHSAQDLYDKTQHVSICDVCDPYLISDKIYWLIITAIEICRHGPGNPDTMNTLR